MDINSIPDIFQSKIRIAIISSLLKSDRTFKEIKTITSASDGNISSHATKLEKSGYITIHKTYYMKKPQTTYHLTQKGRSDFEEYIKALESLLRDSMKE